MKKLPWVTSFVSALVIWIQFADGLFFEWRSDLFTSGEPWRFVTGHLSHWSWDHLIWDVGMFFVLGCVLESRNRTRFLLVLCVTLLLTDVFIRVSGNFDTYRGLSGIALGLFGLAMGELVLSRNRLFVGFGGFGVILVVGKLGTELLSGSAIFVNTQSSDFAIALEAHLAGLAAAACVFVGVCLRFRKRGYEIS